MIINEKNFIKQLKKKDEKALEYIIDTYGGIVKSIVKRHMYNISNYQEECIQDVFLDVWYGIDKYDNKKGDFKNWIAAITKYKCIMYKRKYSPTNLNQDIEDALVTVDDIEVEIQKKELKEEDRKIFKEYYIEGKTIKEISKDMNIKDENIYNRISRGKKKIRILFNRDK